MNLQIKTIEQTDKKLILQSDMLWFACMLIITQVIALIVGIYSIKSFNTMLENNCKEEIALKSDSCQKILNSKTFSWNTSTGKALFCGLPLWFITILGVISQIKNVKCEINKNLGELKISNKSILRTTEETYLIKDIVDVNLKQDNPLSPIVFNLHSTKKAKVDFFVLELKSKLKAFSQIQDFLN